MIDEMIKRNKGKYITQGVSFNKECPRQMELLKKSLMSSVSFSGLAKEMLALRFENKGLDIAFGVMGKGSMEIHHAPVPPQVEEPKMKNVGNFI
jgi:hypothetical protein